MDSIVLYDMLILIASRAESVDFGCVRGYAFAVQDTLAPILIAAIIIMTIVIVLREERRTRSVRRSAKERAAFLTLLTHQMRSPLAAIKANADLLRSGAFGNLKVAQIESLTKMDRSVSDAFEVLHQIVERSGIRTDAIRMRVGHCDVYEAMQASINALHAGIAAKEHVIVIGDRPADAAAFQDPVLLHAVFEEVLQNAILFTRKKGRIALTFQSEPDAILVGVSDTGTGIPKDEEARVFEKFFRGKNAAKMHPSGEGLGLFTVRQLLQSMHGDIRFTANKKAKGTTFVMKVPRKSIA